MDELRIDTLEVPDRVRRQIEVMASRLEVATQEADDQFEISTDLRSRLEAAESKLEAVKTGRNKALRDRDHLSDRLETAESALRSLVEAVEYEQIPVALSDELKAAVEQARSQIEGSK